MARAMWKGAIQFGLVTIPIKLYLATESKGISFNMLHKDDLSRIQMKICCPVEDEVISRGDTVKGYEYSPGEYVVVTDEDLEKVPLKTVRSHRDRAVHQGRARRQRRPVREARLLHRARQDRPQGVLPAQVGARGRGAHGDLQGRDQGPRGARRARPVRRHDAHDDAPLAGRDPLDRRAGPARGGVRLQAGRARDGQAARVGDDRRVRSGASTRTSTARRSRRSSRPRSRARRPSRSRSPRRPAS